MHCAIARVFSLQHERELNAVRQFAVSNGFQFLGMTIGAIVRGEPSRRSVINRATSININATKSND
jgi:hypothetical protein